jgi:RES domain-containing protein
VILRGWRIVSEEQERTAFSGEGARLFGGRWNSPGRPVVYASENKALAALEVRVHLDGTRRDKRYKCFEIEFDDRLLRRLEKRSLPKDWRQEPPPPALQELGDEWLAAATSAILAVPSAIIPEELNYMLNPRHPEFGDIKIDKPGDFAFDPRLF